MRNYPCGNIVGADEFQQVLMDLQLCDLSVSGQRFTWMNKREDEDFVMERLDRAFGIVEWVNKYPLYSLRNLPIVKSDHGSIILDLEFQTPFRKQPFRFELMWLTHAGCKEMVEVAIRMKQNQLQHLQDSIVTNDDVRRERVYREELEELLDREELMWALKARTNWFLHGDRNTRYFQTVVRQRRSKNRIIQIKDEEGNLTDNAEETENIFLESFKRSFRGNNSLTVKNIIQELHGLPIPSLTKHQLQILNIGISN
ncbi:uncharacterized protein LOC115959633 [Quercus lobata]|uniref:uncharacterized protein LOC115959633 n=1 Tax=Quercus lobata TaxID=97700 RepID=UPI0012467994|nr:uncharacterized protein LOC115959633 [Quercus lobata]